ncbi:MAG: hypothetical protein MK085_05500 [Phycisphaerales bacterium]|nr:hypothetical protein [Phycisphaerales bacterium]
MGTPSANPYAQLVLGFRTLAVKILVFVIMASLLAWAIGGTLWPRTTVRMIGQAIEVGGARYAVVYQARTDGQGTFGFATLDENNKPVDIRPDVNKVTPIWREALPLVVGESPSSPVACGFLMGNQWFVGVFPVTVDQQEASHKVIDQLEAARQLARFAAGLEIQDLATQESVRQLVLDAGEGSSPSGTSADASSGPN